MEQLVILIAMLYFHIIDDYYLQGFLAQAKQKSWWMENFPEALYKYDFVVALIEHAFSWTVSIHLPLFLAHQFFGITFGISEVSMVGIFILNLFIHAITDHTKANLKKISLCEDQLIHALQIILTCVCYTTT